MSKLYLRCQACNRLIIFGVDIGQHSVFALQRNRSAEFEVDVRILYSEIYVPEGFALADLRP
jgi:hypothetical protein